MTVDPARQEGRRDASSVAVEAVHRRARDAAWLAPAAVLLTLAQVAAIASGALSHLLPAEQVALYVSGLSAGLSLALLSQVSHRRSAPPASADQQRWAEAGNVLFLAAVGALAGALGSDAFVATTRLTSSSGMGGLAGALVLLLVAIPWF